MYLHAKIIQMTIHHIPDSEKRLPRALQTSRLVLTSAMPNMGFAR